MRSITEALATQRPASQAMISWIFPIVRHTGDDGRSLKKHPTISAGPVKGVDEPFEDDETFQSALIAMNFEIRTGIIAKLLQTYQAIESGTFVAETPGVYQPRMWAFEARDPVLSALFTIIRTLTEQLEAEGGFTSLTPTLILGGQEYLSLSMMGDVNLNVVYTWDTRMAGKAFVVFGCVEKETQKAIPFGNLLLGEGVQTPSSYTPEYEFVVNFPVIARINIVGE